MKQRGWREAKSSALKQRAWREAKRLAWSKEAGVKQRGWRKAKRLAWSKEVGVKQRARRWSKEVGVKQRGWRDAKEVGATWSKELGAEAKRLAWSKEAGVMQSRRLAWSKEVGATWSKEVGVKQRGVRESKRSARSKQVAWREWSKELVREWENSGFPKPILEYSSWHPNWMWNNRTELIQNTNWRLTLKFALLCLIGANNTISENAVGIIPLPLSLSIWTMRKWNVFFFPAKNDSCH